MMVRRSVFIKCLLLFRRVRTAAISQCPAILPGREVTSCGWRAAGWDKGFVGKIGLRIIMAASAIFLLMAAAMSPAAEAASVLTVHNDPHNDGHNLQETILTPRNVRPGRFGKLFVTPLDGIDYGQVLFVPHVDITAGPHRGVQNVLFAATSRDTVYAINADNGIVLWKTNLLTKFHSAKDSVVAREANQNWAAKHQPLEDTPVIDPATGALYVECKETEQGPGTGGKLHWIALLSSLNLSNGRHYAHTINLAECGTHGAYISGPTVRKLDGGLDRFYAYKITFRYLAIDPVNKILYLACADPGDTGPYNGWILGYSTTRNATGNLTVQAQWSATPNGWAGGIWGGAIAFDRQGNLYVETGNGTFETKLIKAPYSGRLTTDLPDLQVPDKEDYGDAALKLTPDANRQQHSDNPNGFGLHVSDYFVPMDEEFMLKHDLDLGSSSPVLLPSKVGDSLHRRLMTLNDKQGIIYLLDRDNFGGYHGDAAGDGKSGFDDVVQKLVHATGAGFSTGAFYAGTHRHSGLIYYSEVGDYLKAFSISGAHINPHPMTQSRIRYGYPGSTPGISADGHRNGIVWTINRIGNCVLAYNALNLHDLLFNSNKGKGLHGISNVLTGATWDMNTTPTVADGRVYVSTGDAMNAYGLLPQNRK
jgi:outer membrane protein assembly factor BamB